MNKVWCGVFKGNIVNIERGKFGMLFAGRFERTRGWSSALQPVTESSNVAQLRHHVCAETPRLNRKLDWSRLESLRAVSRRDVLPRLEQLPAALPRGECDRMVGVTRASARAVEAADIVPKLPCLAGLVRAACVPTALRRFVRQVLPVAQPKALQRVPTNAIECEC